MGWVAAAESRFAQCYNRRVFSDPPLTKRQLGALCVVAGVGLALVAFGADFVGAGRFGGLGPAQKQALLAAAVIIVFGLSLWPAGNRPA